MKKRILYLHLSNSYFNQIKNGIEAGTTSCVFRLANEYWRDKLVCQCYDEVHMCLWYPRPDETDKIIIRKWKMLAKEWILHEEFGPDPVEVFVICFGTENEEVI